MKNALVALSLAILSLIFLPSCKKYYTCSCDGQVDNPYSQRMNKKEAKIEKEKCEATPPCTFKRAE